MILFKTSPTIGPRRRSLGIERLSLSLSLAWQCWANLTIWGIIRQMWQGVPSIFVSKCQSKYANYKDLTKATIASCLFSLFSLDSATPRWLNCRSGGEWDWEWLLVFRTQKGKRMKMRMKGRAEIGKPTTSSHCIGPFMVIICNKGVGLGMTFGLSHSELGERMRTMKEGEW